MQPHDRVPLTFAAVRLAGYRRLEMQPPPVPHPRVRRLPLWLAGLLRPWLARGA